ncbi:MBG domain-containing protein [Daejeonella sp.]|uniref:MBG domain-containing protein n=1 Tax=Daejeonella sp. TaxID=2805397 RepID=UPI0039830FB1
MLSGEVKYDKEYSNVIKIATADRLETKIMAISKPEWLKLHSDPQVRILAGSETAGSANGTGNTARFFAPYALASDSKGTTYVADQVDNRIRKISPKGEVTTLAGSLAAGFANGTGVEARFDTPSGIAVDHHGYVYISDQQNHSIRRISPVGVVSTLAGGQTPGYVDGDAFAARFNSPAGISVDLRGFVYVADRGNNRIRMISPEGKVSTLAGSGQAGFAEGKGKLAKFNTPTGIAVDRSGNIYVTDQVNNRIRKISAEGEVSTFAGTGEFEFRDGEGIKSAFKYPSGIVADSVGNLYVTDQLNHRIRRISPSGKVISITVSGEDDVKKGKTASNLNNPTGICLNNDGNVLVADYHNYNVKEIAFNISLSGKPSRSHVGSHEIILRISNESGTSVQSGQLTVKDGIGPTIVNTFPADLSSGIPRTLNALITFDEAVVLSDSGSITISNASQIIVKYNVRQAIIDKYIELSDDHKSLTLKLKNLPAAATLRISVDNGIVKDRANNLFDKNLSPLASWLFTTIQKEKQAIDLPGLSNKIYGDPVFKLGPIQSSAGLTVEYSAEDPAILFIKGDSARILKAGKTSIIAFQSGDNAYLAEKIARPIAIMARPVVVKPIAGQVITYGTVQPQIRYEIISGSLLNDDKFAGNLEKAKGDSVGIYSIVAGSLTLESNYNMKLLQEIIAVQKAPLLIKASNQTKLAGSANPKFAGIYEGFVNDDNVENLLSKPQFTCLASESSPIGKYSINLIGAAAKNYAITYQPGILTISPKGSTDFNVKYYNLFENMVSGILAASFYQSNHDDQRSTFILTKGDGDEDNNLFKIKGTSIVSVNPLDYEQRSVFSIRVRSEDAYGELTEKKIPITLLDLNEPPEMTKIPIGIVCSDGLIKLTGITAGPEKNQEVTIRVMDLKSKRNLEVSQPENGVSQLKYNQAAGFGSVLNLRIVLTDNGGNANGGIDSAVFTYALPVVRHKPVHIISEKGTLLPRGIALVMTVQGSGKFQWYFNNQRIAGEQDNSINLTAEQSGTISVRLISEDGCINEAKMDIIVTDSPIITCTNLISPNFDSINDAFIIRNIEYYPGNELWILDRSGKQVFNQKNYVNSWKGTHKGGTLPAGTYYYLLELENKTAKLKGYISVVD